MTHAAERRVAISLIALRFLLCVFRLVPSIAHESLLRQENGENMAYPSVAFGWLDDKCEFQAGDIAIIKIKLFDDSFRDRNSGFRSDLMNLSLTVNGKKGNSSYISGVHQFLEGHPNFWNISFTTIRTGQFPVVIADEHFGIIDSSLHFTVTAGHIYPSACIVSWVDFIDDFVAGTTIYLFLLLKDGFRNNVSSGINEPSGDYFTASLSYENGSTAEVPTVKHNSWNQLGHFGLEFVPRTSGNLLLHIYGNNQSLNGSPLQLIIKPGSINPTNTKGEWKYRTNLFQVFSKLEMFIYQKDQFGNMVPGFYPFDTRVVEKTSNLSIPVADLLFEEVAWGTQLLSFVVSEPGEFRLVIYDSKPDGTIWNMTYDFSVFIGYCHESNSFANGSGLASSVAGIMSSFSIYLEDLYHNPSPVDARRLRVEILSENSTSSVLPVILPLQNLVEVTNVTQISDGSTMPVPALPSSENQKVIGNSTTQTSHFNVTYTPEKCGDYKIWIFCGNVPANDANPYMMKVSPGLVDASLSIVQKFTINVERNVMNEFLVQLVDSYHNPVPSEQSKLSLEVSTVNSSSLNWAFLGNENGSYTGQYMAKDAGAYSMCVFFKNMHLSPCPFDVHVYESEYFTVANNDSVFVWEDESLAFDVLSNDYIAGGNFSIIEFSLPLHGSLLQYGKLFRYTPYEGFFGNDSFSYTILDVNKNIASTMVSISVLCKPPQFVSLPAGLHVIEDTVSPKFGGFSGFEIIYSDDEKNVSLAIRAQSGNVFFSPFPMQLQQTQGNLFSVSRSGRVRKDLVISGNVKTINSVLQFVQYLGNENFSGNDIIAFRAINENGEEEASVPVFVEPINDPPIIIAPKFISLTKKQGKKGMQIFDKQRDVFEFSIMDPDIFTFSGNKSHFAVIFSMEVSEGTLSTTLPVGLSKAAELKFQGSNRWQPLQAFVSISNHFVFKGKGIRIHATIAECNSAIQQLYYQHLKSKFRILTLLGTGNDAVLTVTVNDMGNYGCYRDCSEMLSMPLHNEATVSLTKRRPVNRMEVFVLGSAIVVEIIMMLLLGGMLLFFICKCVNALHKDKSDSSDATSTLSCE